MRKMVSLKISIQKKDLWFLSAIVVFLVGVGFVVAYNANWATDGSLAGENALIHGHSPDEIEGGVGGGSTPSGAVMAFNLNACPTGWKLADGTSGTPDLRGVFIRGLDTRIVEAGGKDPGRAGMDSVDALGDYQADELRSHFHSVTFYGNSKVTANSGFSGADAVSKWQTRRTTFTGGAETRPKNVALIYCVKD